VLRGRSVADALDDPVVVEALRKVAQRLVELSDGAEAPRPGELLLQGADEAIEAAIVLGLAGEGGAGSHPDGSELVGHPACLPRMATRARHRLAPQGSGRWYAEDSREARPEDLPLRRAGPRRDPRRPRIHALRRRRPPQGLGAAPPGVRRTHRDAPGPQDHARARHPRLRPPDRRARTRHPRPHDHDQDSRRDVGHRRDRMPYRRGKRCRLRRSRPLHGRVSRGVRPARRGMRLEAIEYLREAINFTKGRYEDKIAEGTKLRHDHGSQFISHAFQDELKTLGIESSPSSVRQPEGNGCVERFIRTLKAQLLWLHQIRTVEELKQALRDFAPPLQQPLDHRADRLSSARSAPTPPFAAGRVSTIFNLSQKLGAVQV